MACKTCRREDMPDHCGPVGDAPCRCCGMQIIARAEDFEEIPNNEEREPESRDNS